MSTALKQKPSELTSLSAANLKLLPASVSTPKYDRAQIKVGIVHFGVGGFHRAHEAIYTNDVMNAQAGDWQNWGICGMGLMEADKKMRDALTAQDHLYAVVERSGKTDTAQVIGSIVKYLYAPENQKAAFAQLTDPSVRIVSLTVTENGYYLDPTTKQLNVSHPDVQFDVQNPGAPKTALGYIVEALKQRKTAGTKPFTVLSCDNIQHNGDLTKSAIITLAKQQGGDLAGWIESNVTFPNSMVDRITPVTKPEDVALVETNYGIADKWPVVCESFRQWVIEDKFCNGRPAWDKFGAQFVPDVLPYEVMKLRLLNASHLFLACIGFMAGLKYVDEAMAHADIRRLTRNLMDKESTPTLGPVPGINLDEYKQTLIERFSNPSIKDTLERVATDAPLNTLLAVTRDQLKSGRSVELCGLGLAAWIRRVRGSDEKGAEFTVRHPLAATLKQKAIEGNGDPTAVLSIKDLFGEDLIKSPQLVEAIKKPLESFYKTSVAETIKKYS